MKKYFVDKNSDKLLLFFTGWGCDEYEFEHLEADSDILYFYDYIDLNYNFDFSKYKEINLIAFSAGVFVASVLDFDLKINKKIAISGNPYLFDEELGLSKEVQTMLCNVTEENADDFAKNYLVKTEEEYKKFHNSHRTVESCISEFESLKKLYERNFDRIKDIYDTAIISDGEPLFNPDAQKRFYGERARIVQNARHNIFFRIERYEDIFDIK